MSDEDLVLRASMKDDLSRPLDKVQEKVDDTTQSVDRLGRSAGATSRASSQMDSRLSRLASGGLSRVRNVAFSAARYVGYGATALVAAGGAAVGFGVKIAANMQTAKIAFTTMLGSARKADTFLQKLAVFAAKTPFEFPELQTAASSLISAGIEADKVIPIMTTLGDVTSGMGTGAEGVQRATVALQQMNAAGRITGEDLNQLRDAGIPVYNLLAAATGKSKAEVVKLAQAGKLGSKELGQMMKALETGKGLERFSGLMDKQSASLSGVWSTLHDTFGMGLAKALQPAVPALTKLTLKASDLVGKGMIPLQHGISSVVAEATELADSGKLQKWASTGKTEVAGFWHMVQPLVVSLLELGHDSLPAVGSSLGVVVTLLGVAVHVITPLIKGFNALPDGAKKAVILAVAVAFLADKMGTLQTKAGSARDTIKDVGVKSIAMRGAIGLAGAGLLAFASAAGDSHRSLADVATVAGSMAIGFAAGGPWGAAIGGAGAIMQIFSGRSQRAADAQRHLESAAATVAATLDRQTGAMTKVTRATAAKQLADTGALQAASAMGISVKDVTSAALGSAAAQDRVNAGIREYAKGVHGFGDTKKAASNIGLLSHAIGSTGDALDKERSKIYLTNEALGRLSKNHPKVSISVNTDEAKARVISIQRIINGVHGKVVTLRVNGGPTASSGDTATRHGWGGSGRGRLGQTMAAHGAVSGRLGGGYRVTNALTGGGGHGRGSGDHQAGRAVDVVGRNLPAYAREVRAAGGYARIHGEGGGKHVHAVMGDTATPHRGSRPHSGSSTHVTVEHGAIQINGSHLSKAELADAVQDALDAIMRENEETSA